MTSNRLTPTTPVSGDHRDASETSTEEIDSLLALVAAERRLRNAPTSRWMEDNFEAHGEACDAVWTALYAMLDRRNDISPRKPPEDLAKVARKEIVAHLKHELPSLIAQALDDL